MENKIDFHLGFTYNERRRPSLVGVEGHIGAGKFVVLCGCSGCGKSTLLRCINHLIPEFYEGELTGFCRINGNDLSDCSIGAVGKQVASVFQDPRSQFFTVNSSSEVAFGLENFGLSHDEMVDRVNEGFQKFGLDYLKDRPVFELSSGERQLVAILSAWALDTDVILMDEPTANLDQGAISRLRGMLSELKSEGKTIVVSEHRLYYLAGLADEYWYMDAGRMVKCYSSQEMLRLTEGELRDRGLRMPEERDIKLTGIHFDEDPVEDERKEAKAHHLTCENVGYRYRGAKKPTLKSVNLALKTGEVVALAGPNGNGKTTFGKVLCGIYRASSGKIALDGVVERRGGLQEKSLFVMQEAEFQFFTNSVWNELKYGKRSSPDLETEMERLLKQSGLWELRNRHPFTLSGGQMQKLVLLLAYFSEKPVVVLDEPTAGLDGKSLKTCTQMMIALFCCTTSTFADPSLVNGMFLSGMLLNLYDRKYKSSIGYGVVYAALLFAYLAFPNVVTGLLINVIPRFLVIGEFVSALISNDGGSRTIAALRYMRMPERAIMIFSVIFRFVPVMEKDLSLMKQYIHTRGFFKTVREKIAGFPEYMEILLAPLILRVIRIAESLSASAETRGIALPGCRQSFTSLKVNRSDGVLTVLIAALIGLGFFYTRIVALFYALLEGMVVFSIGFKVRKRGAMPMEMMSVKESENLKYVMTHAGKFIMSWGWMVLLVATALVAYIGSLLGKRVVRNHIRKAEGGYEDED